MHICSVRVAASQSNIVFNGSREGSSSVNTHTGSVSVSEARSVSPGMNIMNMKNVAMRKYDDIVCLNGMCQKCVKCTDTDAKLPTCDMKYKKKKHTVAKPGPKSRNVQIHLYFQQLDSLGRGAVGEITPIKRKLLNSGHVVKIVQSFDVAADSLPGESQSVKYIYWIYHLL